MEKKWTKEEIKEKLKTDDRWLYRAIFVIFEKQTYEEQNIEATVKANGVGFTGADARLMSYLAKWVKQHGRLNEKWRAEARRRMVKYSGQLAKIANKDI